jgi:hypothetical protein
MVSPHVSHFAVPIPISADYMNNANGNSNGYQAYGNQNNYNQANGANGNYAGNQYGAGNNMYGGYGAGNNMYGGYGAGNNMYGGYGAANNMYGGYFGAWMNNQYGNQNPQNYYNQWMNNQNGNNNQFGYYDANGQYVDLCEGNGWSDSYGREYDLDCQDYQSKMTKCSDGSMCDFCEYEVDQKFSPCDQYVCGDYYTYCSDLYEPEYQQMYQWRANNNNKNNNNKNYNGQYQGNNNNNQQNELYKFLDCTEYVNDYGQRWYIGPHCGSDHYTISLGIFADENCVQYLGETVSLSKVLGYGMDDEQFFHLPHECISCDGAVSREHFLRTIYQYQHRSLNSLILSNFHSLIPVAPIR